MKNYYLFFAVICFFACSSNSSDSGKSVFEYQNPISSGIDKNGLRDCQVLRDGDWWYLTGTSYPHWSRQETEGNLNKGVALYKYVGQWTGYAVADLIEGPYQVVTEEKPLCHGNDLTFFQDDDKKVWAFWNQGREFGIGFAQIDLETATFLSEPESAIKPAEVTYDYGKNGDILKVPGYDGRPIPKVAKYHDWDAIGIEGAYVIKHQDIFYLFYSSWTRGYEIGYATAKSITGPWTKFQGNPFYGAMNKSTCDTNGFEWSGDPNSPFNAVGHNEIFIGPDGRYWLSCHGITEDAAPFLVIDPIWFDEKGQVQSNGPTYTQQVVKLDI